MDRTDDVDESHIVRIKSGIDFGKLMSDEGTTFEIDIEDLKYNLEETNSESESLLKYSKLDCLGVVDDEDTGNDEPFIELAKKMTDILPDGKIKKRILREGIGEIIPKDGFVTCDYNAFIEHNPEPFDSTYAFHRSFRFQLGAGTVLLGLDLAVKTMKINEKSQFLVDPDYAYGPMGCLERIPGNATILFEIEVKNCINSGPTTKDLDENESNSFEKVYEYVEALKSKGNDFYKRELFRQAIKEYNIAVSKLQKCPLRDYSDQEKQQALLLKLYTNLVVVYTKKQMAKKACIIANDIHYLVKGTSLKIPVKVYFHNARALMMLGNLSEAERKLKLAHRLEPNNGEIADLFVKLEKLKEESRKHEQTIAKALIRNNEGRNKTTISEEFKAEIDKILTALLEDCDWLQYKLNDGLSKEEIDYVKTTAEKKNLKFRDEEGKQFYVFKSQKK